jgi:hypothetical protein
MKKSTKKTWYQARIFVRPNLHHLTSSTTDYSWSFQVYGNIIKRFLEKYPKVPFWFTKYACPLTMDSDGSDNLPKEYQYKENWTNSVRFRFLVSDKKQIAFLENLLEEYTGVYWVSQIEKYDHFYDLCGYRFVPEKTNKKERNHRGNIVQKSLEWNCRLLLDCLYFKDGVWYMERNFNPNNTAFGNISRSMVHLFVNPWATTEGSFLPIYGINWDAIYGV